MFNLLKNLDFNAIVDDKNNVVTYRELLDFANKINQHLNSRSLCMILCKNSVGSIISYVSSYTDNAVSMLIKHDLDHKLLDNLLESYRPKFIFCPSDKVSLFNKSEKIFEFYDYCLLKTNFKADYLINDKLALLLTTSGSTGSPKFVRISYENIESNTDSIKKYLQIDSKERPITVLPMYYTYGLSVINTALSAGATLLVTDKSIMQKEFWTFFKEQQASSFSGVPYTFEMLNLLRFYRMNLPSLKTLTQAGGHLNPKLQSVFAKYCIGSSRKFYVMYGQCEATARMSYLPPEESLDKLGAIGKPIDGGAFFLLNESEGKQIKVSEPNMQGELVYTGKNVSLGYANDRNDLILDDLNQGILHTGDIAYFDESGTYFICGRKKRFIKIYGNRVNLDEIDDLLKEEFKNVDSASFGIDDHMYLFITESCVENYSKCHNEKDLTADIKNYISNKTGLNPIAFNVVVIDEIPRNEAGKVYYKTLASYCCK